MNYRKKVKLNKDGGKMEGLNMAIEDIRRQISDLTGKLQ